jgi:hypothetical protein
MNGAGTPAFEMGPVSHTSPNALTVLKNRANLVLLLLDTHRLLVNNVYNFSSYLTGNTLRLHYENQSVDAV